MEDTSQLRDPGNTKDGPQQQNCAWEICCETPEARADLVRQARKAGCHTIEQAFDWLFEYHTLAPRSFVQVKLDIAKAALAGRT